MCENIGGDDIKVHAASITCMAHLGWNIDLDLFKTKIPQLTPKIINSLEFGTEPETRESCFSYFVSLAQLLKQESGELIQTLWPFIMKSLNEIDSVIQTKDTENKLDNFD